jgi:hypothetical protein
MNTPKAVEMDALRVPSMAGIGPLIAEIGPSMVESHQMGLIRSSPLGCVLVEKRYCRRCSKPIPPGRRRVAKYCSDDCRRRASEGADPADGTDDISIGRCGASSPVPHGTRTCPWEHPLGIVDEAGTRVFDQRSVAEEVPVRIDDDERHHQQVLRLFRINMFSEPACSVRGGKVLHVGSDLGQSTGQCPDPAWRAPRRRTVRSHPPRHRQVGE